MTIYEPLCIEEGVSIYIYIWGVRTRWPFPSLAWELGLIYFSQSDEMDQR
jgi:hypothetical protein